MRVQISRTRRRLLVAAPCAAMALIAATIGLSGCGSGGKTLNLGGANGGGVAGLGRASKLIGSWSTKQTLADGKTEETILDFAPGSAAESVTGSYTFRVLSPRAGGGSDFVAYETGTLTGSILANGDLSLTYTPDNSDGGGEFSETRRAAKTSTHAAGKSTRAAGTTTGTSEYSFGADGRTMTDIVTNSVFSAFEKAIQAFQAQSVAGTWTGTPTGVGGFQLLNPKDGTEVSGAILPISIQYAATDTLARKYTASLTLSDPTTGKPYTATGVTAHLYSQYDSQAGTIPANLSGTTTLYGDQLFVSGSGHLPASAGTLTIPGLPVGVPLAGRAFVFEAGVSSGTGVRSQLGALWLKFDATTDPVLYPLLTAFTGQNTDATGGYIEAGYFYVLNGTTVTPTPTPTPTPSPAGGIVQFSNVVSTTANTNSFTKTDSSGEIDGQGTTQVLNANIVDTVSTSPERDLVIQLSTGGDPSSVTVGKTYPIVPASTSSAAGVAQVNYYETPGSGTPAIWGAQSGSVVVTARSGNVITLSIVNAAMTVQNNYGVTATGTFTINGNVQFPIK